VIAGAFRDGHPRQSVTLIGATGTSDVEVIVDTGFEGDLTLPSSVAQSLGGSPDGIVERELADGTLFRCPFYNLEVILDGETRTVQALVLGRQPLLGTTFLQDHLLTIEVAEGGEVFAEPF